MKLQCLIVDDEPLALDLLEGHIQAMADLELAGRCANALDAGAFLRQKRVDLLFLDIQMPVLTGIDLIKTLQHRPKIILTTAYKEYAFDAFQLDAADYLLKPITFARFLKSINKVCGQLPQTAVTAAGPSPIFEEAFVYLKTEKRLVKVILKEILFIESIRDYTKVITQDQRIIAHQRISQLEEKLPEDRFLRIHRSYLINRLHVQAFSPQYVEIGEKQIPIGRQYKDRALAILMEHRL
ncbi:LytR/AlgR family response regulator transcription factor [Flavilitoribacter nigricans]|uniref:DNA-binding response regulator n=1 Tax=Flavilitoribacter nigricans (strain ATCC 23147 / DSM 23189 / NBRC 102662 / NCIMB 1420 / SS-2) TaxID=1122177 RepID=A0A2D0MYV7_FLAN2|nr:LytTR family DNA-binding domain-containing protein [Flavilitoribacter nigricans]PHN01360.1 DNA-binding response regulator [Flavilitoribacter nigricans DSM 23189 = NBRC 102662]